MAKGRRQNSRDEPPGELASAAFEQAENTPGTVATLPRPKRIPPSTLKLQFAGELVLVKRPPAVYDGLFRRYEALFEALANMERPERVLNYKFLAALMLTSHAKKTKDLSARRQLFDLKNELYFDIANHPESRRRVAFRYLTTRNFRVVSYCEACTRQNTEAGVKRHDWKFCEKCTIDRDFYNVLSMHHKFTSGSATLFLSHDLIQRIEHLKMPPRGNLDDNEEEAQFQQFHYNARNLDAFDLPSVLELQKKFLNR